MSTTKPRIQAYVQGEIYQQFEQERSQWDLSQSQALERILSERYQLDNKAVNEPDMKVLASVQILDHSLAALRNRVEALELLLKSPLPISESELVTNESDSELPILSYLKSVGETESELLSELKNDRDSKLDSKFYSELQLVQEALNKLPTRLRGFNDKYKRENGLSKVRMPSGTIVEGIIVDFSLRSKSCKLFNPITDSHWSADLKDIILPGELDGELPSESSNSLPSELDDSLPSELLEGISQRALARRLKCSHPYLGKLQKAGEIGRYTQKADPDGIEWELKEGKYYPKVLSRK